MPNDLLAIPPPDIARLRPLIRILLNQFLTRLTSHMAFDGGRSVKHYKHRLLLMFDEFTSIGKIFVPEEVSNLTFGGPKRNRL